jgi:hypothetical protein
MNYINLLSIYFLFNILAIIKTIEIQEEVIPKNASVYYIKTTGKYKVVEGVYDKMAAAYATYTASYETKGWDFLTLSSYDGVDDKYPDEIKNYAMGYLEGVLTYKRIYPAYYNLNNYKYYQNDGIMPNSTYEFFQKNLQYMKEMTTLYKDKDPYWHEVNNLYMQMRGLHEGYNSMAPENEKIDLVHFQTVVSLGDVDEIANWKKENRPDYSKMTTEELIEYIDLRSHCSAFLKVADDFSDVWFGHNTWTTYNKLISIYKEYKYVPNAAFPIKAQTITMSSYPAAVNSQDDFYITDANLYVAETTNHVMNLDLFDLLTPKSLMCWMRTMVANRLTDDGYSWTQVFARNNSGTYNNQFQILDLKKIDTTKKKIESGALYIVEQLPGSCDVQEVTDNLKKGYWPSYNTPFIRAVREKGGIIDAIIQNPNLTVTQDYDTCARAKIFRREQSKVKDIKSYENLIRYNDYEKDEFSERNPSYSIAARYDLKEENSTCYGATDAKFASINEIKTSGKKIVHIISGPTTNGLPPFNWDKAQCKFADKIRFKVIGQINEYNFDWIDYELTLF